MKNKEALEALELLASKVDGYKNAKDILRAALTQPAQEWQDISTAPRDGSSVMLYGGEACSEIGNPYPIDEAVKAYWNKEANYSEDEDGEYTAKGGWEFVDTSYYGISLKNPTHWMPLPAPPTTLMKE